MHLEAEVRNDHGLAFKNQTSKARHMPNRKGAEMRLNESLEIGLWSWNARLPDHVRKLGQRFEARRMKQGNAGGG